MFHARNPRFDHIVRMSVDEKQIGIAVIVVVKELQSPAAQQLSRRRNLTRLIREDQLLIVMIKTEKLLIDIGDEKILPAVAIVISRIDTHA